MCVSVTDNTNKLTFSIIIPVWPQDKRPLGLDYIDRIDFPRDRFEVICARGFSPCKQRNEAARIARGDVLVFFDDDSCPKPNFLLILAKHFEDEGVIGVGGPNPGLQTDEYIPNLIEAVFHSRIAVLSKTKRYKPTGKLRVAADSDLIFCNFAIRRQLYLDLNGLDERLCPNEENEFFERLYSNYPKAKLLYDPELIAYEPRPRTVKAFLRKMCGYGRGRAKQFKIRPSLWSGLHLAGCLSIILPVLLFVLWGMKGMLYLFLPYVAALSAASISCLITNQRRSLALGLGPAIFALHLSYVLGMWKGLFEPITPKTKANMPIQLEHYKTPDTEKTEAH